MPKAMKRVISKVVVLGSGIMGSRIACHFANAGYSVLLLDIETPQSAVGANAKYDKNSLVNSSLQNAIKSNPSPLFKKSFASRIKTGNFSDNMKDIGGCDWVLEAVVENIDIKKKIFDDVEKHRKQGTLITSNTSGIPIHLMMQDRSEDFQKHFCGTHFFNPPRYLRLLEIIPTEKTSNEVVDFLVDFGDRYLGKQTVLCKDTPAFIANRIGIYSIMSLFHLVEKMELTVDEVDRLTGDVIGRPKSATFRTVDVVGLDTLIKVADYLYASCPNDEKRETFKLPDYVQKVAANKWFGDKSGQGFYKKVKSSEGKSEILSLDLKTLEYKPKDKVKFASLEQAKAIDNLRDSIKFLLNANDKAGEFYRASFYSVFHYISNRIPEIADDLYLIDDAIRAGFGWELGPFEIWDALGVEETAKKMEAAGMKPVQWVYDMLQSGKKNFYKTEKGKQLFYHISSSDYKSIAGMDGIIFLDTQRERAVWKNTGAHLIDLGDGILNLEFHTKMNTIGAEIIEGVNKAIEIGEKDFRGLVIANEAQNFSAGANLALIFMLATEQEWEEIDLAVRTFQNINMKLRYSSIPVVVAPRGLTLGGGCEMTLHADKVVTAAETYIGLVEFGVGLIPGGGGSKEMTLRASDSYAEGIIDEQVLREYYLTIAQAKVSTSGREAFDLKILKNGRDEIVMNSDRQVSEAKRACIELADSYVKPNPGKDIKVLGKGALSMIYAGANAMTTGHFISQHDELISRKLAFVMCGGDLSTPALVSEQYLLDLEKEAFLSLCGEKRTLERIQSILTTGKPLRN
jgi:3-hydroxyacyl-CoA dehydrogenase